MLQKHNVQFVVVLGKAFGLGRAVKRSLLKRARVPPTTCECSIEKTSIARGCSFALLSLVYRACSCSLLFKAPHPHLLLCYYIILNIVLFFIYSVGFSLFLSVMGAGAGAGAGLIAGLHVGRALRCSGCLGLGSAVPVPHVPGHPTSICDEAVKPL